MNPTGAQSEAFQAAYEASDRQLRLRHARVGCVLALILMPAGTTLDWFVYPDLLVPILKVRWLTDLFIAGVMITLAYPWGQRHLRVLGSAWALSCAVAISWMIYISEGANSPYYAGLNLVIIIACLLMPYTLREATVVCSLVIALYFVACMLHRANAVDTRILFNNLYFLVLTSIIAITSCHYYNLRRIEDFRLRHELDERNRQLAELDRLKSEFFANISHELRTPLTLILAPVEDLLNRRDSLPPRVIEALTLTQKNGLRLLKLINDLLEVVRLDARRGKPEATADHRPVDLASLVPGIVDAVRHLASAKGLTLRSEREADALVVRGDASSLERVFLNLLTNAIKFTPAGGTITVRWRRDGGSAWVDVADTGIGIPESDLPHIFDRFRQVDGSATRKHQGVGLGLALVRDLVEEHRGDLVVRSTLGAGATFSVRLPLIDLIDAPPGVDRTHAAPTAPITANGDRGAAEAFADPVARTFEAAAQVALEIAPEDEADLSDTGRGERCLLVVDDEPDMRRFIVSILADEYRVAQAADGESGLAKARRERPDAILLDLMLPGIDGLEVCRRIRADRTLDDTRIILLTARADESSKITALERGADDFLTKPFSSLEVRTRVRNLLRTSTLQRSLRDRNAELESTIRELETTRAQLVQSEKMNALGSLAAGLLHEINNPLNYTLTALQVAQLNLREDDADLRDTLRDIDEGMKRIHDIVADLRAFAYPEQAGRFIAVDLADVVQTAMRFTAHARDGVSVAIDLPPEPIVTGSRSQLTQVLVNLIDNAIKAVESIRDEREPRVDITAERTRDRMRVRVRDNGVGMDVDRAGRAFDPFFTTRDVGQGMGLGLSICHTIITAHGGTIRLNSQKGAWTEVAFDLPLVHSELER